MNKESIAKIIKYEKLSNEEITELVWMANKDLYKERPVDINTFISDSRFVKNKWPNIFPIWKDVLNQIYPTPFAAPYNEVLISAAAGAGKTVTATIGNLYDMYKLGCLKDPCKFYNLSPGTMLIFAVFSATGSTAAVNWQDITTGIEMCPWLNEKVIDRRGLEKKNGSLVPVEILPGIFIQTGSKFQHSMGKAIFDGLMDEAAFGGDNIKEAQKTYNELSSRMATRFRSYSESGNLPGHLFLISSPKEAGDFMQYRIDKAEQSGSKHTLIKKNISSWDANPANDSDNKFTVFVGNEFKEPKIYEENESPSFEDMDYLIYPPMSYYDNFKMDILGSIMNYGGVTTIADTGLFKSPSLVNEAMVLKNPFNSNVIQLPFSKSDKHIMDFMDLSYFKDIRHPECNRFIHIDVAFSSNTIDRYGIAASYCTLVDRTVYQDLSKGDINLAEYYSKAEKMYYVDWALGIEPCPHQEIPLSKVRDFIFYLMKNLNYPVACISADTFQSKQTLQDFEQEKYKTESISLDRTRDPYLFLKQLVYNKQILMPKHDELKKEILQLRDNGKKIDHPMGGCFTEDTKVSLVDGRELTIKELMVEQEYKQNWVYTFNEETKKIEPKPIKKVFQSKIIKELLRVTLDNGQVITCTPEHRFMLRDGSYEEIRNLEVGTSLMPLYRKVSNKGLNGYRLVYQPVKDSWHYEHRIFASSDQIKKGMVVHHANYNKLDNCPSNLKVITKSKHATIHNNCTLDYENISRKLSLYHQKMRNTTEYNLRNAKISKMVREHNKIIWDSLTEEEKQQKQNYTLESREAHIREIEQHFNVIYNELTVSERNSYGGKLARIKDPNIVIKSNKALSDAHKEGKFKKAIDAISGRYWVTNGVDSLYIKREENIPRGYWRGRTLKQSTLDKMRESAKRENWSEQRRLENSKRISESTSNRVWVTNGVSDKYICKDDPIPEGYIRGRSKVGKNHKIASIEKVLKPCKVYDLEIQDNHNFALTAGVFVHNSKDISDAVGGSIWSCANSNNIVNLTKLTQAVLNPYATTAQFKTYTEQELKSLEMMEFERMKSQYSNGIFKGL